MSKQIMVLPLHSVADIITNSSSELFICATSDTIDDITSMLNKLAEVVGRSHGVGTIKVVTGIEGLKKILFDDLDDYFDSDRLYNVVSRFTPYDLLKKWEFPKRVTDKYDYDYNNKETYEQREARYDLKKAENQATVDQFFADHAEELEPYMKSCVVLVSEEDNSIPYELFDIIESRLHAVRFHLG